MQRIKPIHITAIFSVAWLVILYAALLPAGNCWFFQRQLGQQSSAELLALGFYFYSAFLFTLLYRRTHHLSYVGFFSVAVFFFLEKSHYLSALRIKPNHISQNQVPFSLKRPLVEILESMGLEYYVLSSLLSMAVAIWIYFMLMNAPKKEKIRRDMYYISMAPVVVTLLALIFDALTGKWKDNQWVCGWERRQELVETILASCFAYYSAIRWYGLRQVSKPSSN